MCAFSHIWLFPAPWTVAQQATSVHGILQARTPDWVAISSPGHLPQPGIEPTSSALAGGLFASEDGDAWSYVYLYHLEKGLVGTAGEGWMGYAGRSGFTYTLYHVSDSSRDAVARHRELSVVPCDDLQRGRGAGLRSESVYVCIQLALLIIQQRLRHPCKAIWQPTPLSFLENSVEGGAWRAAVHGIAKCRARLSD